jgi:hypothetical protein
MGRIIVKNACKRKPNCLYHIDAQGNLIEEMGMPRRTRAEQLQRAEVFNNKGSCKSINKKVGPVVFNNKKIDSAAFNNKVNVENNSAEFNSTIRKSRVSKLQLQVMSHLLNVEHSTRITYSTLKNKDKRRRLSEHIKTGPRIQEIIKDLSIDTLNKNSMQKSIYRSLSNLESKGLIVYWWGEPSWRSAKRNGRVKLTDAGRKLNKEVEHGNS